MAKNASHLLNYLFFIFFFSKSSHRRLAVEYVRESRFAMLLAYQFLARPRLGVQR